MLTQPATAPVRCRPMREPTRTAAKRAERAGRAGALAHMRKRESSVAQAEAIADEAAEAIADEAAEAIADEAAEAVADEAAEAVMPFVLTPKVDVPAGRVNGALDIPHSATGRPLA